ncbi:PQQ-binding-like beta-propeller repeat protein [Streptomyces fractus]|uniref:outer membrane protein assembly factor BamB family protein n=1 Tax=Streptomyces fractus TaxID=641806 RepID=UPI003CEAA77B
MTQPPPPRPPNEPPSPQGGFGAPPPMPPYTAPGYGTLRSPLPPESRGRPGQQPYEQQHPYGHHQEQPPTRKKVPPIALVIGAAVVAIALIVGGGVLYFSTSGGDAPGAGSSDAADGDKGGDGFGGPEEEVPADPSARTALRLPAPKVAKRQVDNVRGSWLTDRTYAKAGLNQLAGYDAASGRKTWTLPLSGQTCAGTDSVNDDGLAAVVSEDAKRSRDNRPRPCTRITVFDVNTGHKVWSQTVRQGTKDRRFEELSFSGNTLAVGGGFDGGAAFDVKSGRILWQPDTGTCQDMGYRGGTRLVAVRKCGAYGDERYEVQLLDPTTGGPRWSYAIATGPTAVKVLSTKPVVVGIGTGGNSTGTINSILTVDDRGKLMSKIALDPKKFDFACEAGKIEGCAKTAVGNGRVYLATRQHTVPGNSGTSENSGDVGMTNEIVSYSLETGKRTGDRVEGGDHSIFPVRMDGGNILAFKTGAYDKGSAMVTIDPTTMKQRTLLETPATPAVREAIGSMAPGQASSELHYSKGRLFLGSPVISAPYGKDDKRFTALGFTTG